MIYLVAAIYCILISTHLKSSKHDAAVVSVPFWAAVLFYHHEPWTYAYSVLVSVIICTLLGRLLCKHCLTLFVCYALIGIKLIVLSLYLVLDTTSVATPKTDQISGALLYVDTIIITVLVLSLRGVKATLYDRFRDYQEHTDGD